jgi:hypothetical protein
MLSWALDGPVCTRLTESRANLIRQENDFPDIW